MFKYHAEFVNIVQRKLLMIRVAENGERQALLEDGRWAKLEFTDEKEVMKNSTYLEVK